MAACCKSQHVSCSRSPGRWLYRLTQGFVLSANPILAFSSGKKRSHKISIGLNKRDNKRNGNRERLLLPSFEGINTMAPEKYKEEVWRCQKTSFFLLQNCCVTSVRRDQAA